ncbi:MAG: ABC transporter ATP-binding protein [Woeseiaceae bacterium]|nr:ABC transporter ATP-binding protein [Woeseiaceae bacterium]
MNSPPEPESSQVRVTNLCRSYVEGGRKHPVLEYLNLDVRKGDTVALRGRSGSGKSTLLNLISGIDVPDKGEVHVAGLNLTKMSEHERTLFRRRHIGFVYQAFNLVSTLTVADNVRLVLELNGVAEKQAAGRVAELLKAVRLDNRTDSFPDVLSGGEQQRVAIARALAHGPALLLADEPTGNLDDHTATAVLELLDRLVRSTGGTMIIATHSAKVASYCSRVFELRNGNLLPVSQ